MLLLLTACGGLGITSIDGDWTGEVILDGQTYDADLRIGPLEDAQSRRSSSLIIQTVGKIVPYCRADGQLECFCAGKNYKLSMEGSVRGRTWSGAMTLQEGASSAQNGVFELEKQ